jgi:hypothetical protein
LNFLDGVADHENENRDFALAAGRCRDSDLDFFRIGNLSIHGRADAMVAATDKIATSFASIKLL